ncbi:hypothetical protein V2S66_33575 [Streptomyces sp. V4-01]|uniref:PknH-like extracellular domain-containing protein n=1 Tax=Actinacidiphila polyblastidii TaxID=3110430 RepID=A0ABU7PMH8_9ACTN|nr:hypothetical protein [Streptomyces sp. V4-01]
MARKVRAPHRPDPRSLAGAVIVLAVIAAASACGSPGPRGAGPKNPPLAASHGPGGAAAPSSRPAAVPDSNLAKGLVLPLEPYMMTYPEEVTLDQLSHRMTTECMARYGFHYVPTPAGSHPPPSVDAANMVRRYGIMDLTQAGTSGYHLAYDTGQPPAPLRMTVAEYTVLTGRAGAEGAEPTAKPNYKGREIPQGGCLGEAARKSGENVDQTLVERLNKDSLDRSQTEPRVRAAIGAWSACMKKNGYTIANPLVAGDHIGGETASGPEIDQAVADVSCKAKTGLVQVWYQADAALQRNEIEQNQLALAKVKQQLQAALQNAAKTTG